MSQLKIITVAEIAAMSKNDKAKFFATSIRAARVGYIHAAKGIVALTDELKSESKAIAFLKECGSSDNDVKNAKRLVAVYDAVVRPGHADEDWFNDVTFLDATAINAAVARVGIKSLVNEGLFSREARLNRTEFELVAETGMFKAARVAAKEKEAEKAAAAEKKKAADDEASFDAATKPAGAGESTAPAGAAPTVASKPEIAGATTTPVEDKSKPATTVAKPAPSPMAEFDTTAATFEGVTLAVLAKVTDEVGRERIRARVASIMVAVETAIAAKPAKSKKTA